MLVILNIGVLHLGVEDKVLGLSFTRFVRDELDGCAGFEIVAVEECVTVVGGELLLVQGEVDQIESDG